jgi:hypothetical protein
LIRPFSSLHTLGNVRYLSAESGDHFVGLLNRILRQPRPVRRVTFGLKTPAWRTDAVLMHTVPRFIMGLAGTMPSFTRMDSSHVRRRSCGTK